MRVNLKGVHRITRVLATGESREYYYAWRGGPRLVGEPGSPEFLASYQAAHNARKTPPRSQFKSILIAYIASPEFTARSPKTRCEYARYLRMIEERFATLPIQALDDPRVTRDFLEWRDEIAVTSPSSADNAWKFLMRVISWARDRGETTYRPPERIERLYHADRSEKIWTEEHVARFMESAPIYIQRAMVLALETGQRQGDLLRLPWSAYDGSWITLRQGKTGAKVRIPVTKCLNAILDNTPRVSTVILVNSRGRPWLERSFRDAWHAAYIKSGIEDDLHFHDLRGTAITRLAEAGCTTPEIAAISGHTMKSVEAILESYVARTDKIAVAAIAKLERGRS